MAAWHEERTSTPDPAHGTGYYVTSREEALLPCDEISARRSVKGLGRLVEDPTEISVGVG
jgi:hypothetical protein